jgi:hypothetical protein
MTEAVCDVVGNWVIRFIKPATNYVLNGAY